MTEESDPRIPISGSENKNNCEASFDHGTMAHSMSDIFRLHDSMDRMTLIQKSQETYRDHDY